ncbi:hypothetical protein H710_01028 [Bartonella bacilliformis Ver097]|uniref:Uncharacterized protein n=1 Tax=Bartonella bacilliformis Ver097 TaxID=1293911 RepID=A0A072R023_BARBA|nr:hypothetical protein H710_01028 [Bartonella bacilliformis Ver097]
MISSSLCKVAINLLIRIFLPLVLTIIFSDYNEDRIFI